MDKHTPNITMVTITSTTHLIFHLIEGVDLAV